jgi:hypothetical protein
LKPIYVSLLVAAMGVAATTVCTLSPAQDTSAPTQGAYVPKNLKVLPKDLTGAQVRQIMSGWADQLGGDCSTCHVRNANDIGPNGRPRYDFADDSKEEKKTARVMYTMVQSINANFISTVPNSGMPVVCGTCHRGHLSPPPFSGPEDAKPAARAK